MLPHVAIKQGFGVGVDIERSFMARFLDKAGPTAIDRGAGGIDEGDAGVEAQMEQFLEEA